MSCGGVVPVCKIPRCSGGGEEEAGCRCGVCGCQNASVGAGAIGTIGHDGSDDIGCADASGVHHQNTWVGAPDEIVGAGNPVSSLVAYGADEFGGFKEDDRWSECGETLC